MAPNKRKILEAARKYAQKGQKDKALKEYEKLLKADPRDAKLRLEIGDAYRRWDQTDDAVAAYSKVAEQYMNEGFDARAVAVFKQIQNLAPDRYETYTPLAELYQRMGLTAEAIQTLQTAADGLHREGRKRDALELLRKMAALDPSNTTSRIKVADLLRQEGMNDEALLEYQAACDELVKQGEADAAEKALSRMLEVDPNRIATLTALVDSLVSRGRPEPAESFAKRIVQLAPEEPAHYERLASVYAAQKRDEDVANTYRQLAEMYRARGDEDKARDLLQRFVAVGDLGGSDDSPFGEQGEPLLSDEEMLSDDLIIEGGDPPDLDTSEEPLIELSDEPVVSDDPEPEPEIDLEDEQPEEPPAPVTGDPEQLLAEASVYLRYGKRAQALRNLEGILERDPSHRGALEKLGEAHADGGDPTEAVAAWQRAAERAREDGDAEGLAVLRDRLAAIDADAAAAIEVGTDVAEDDIEIDLSGPSEDLPLEEPAEPSPAVEEPPPVTEVDLGDDLDDEIEIEIDGDDFDEPAEEPAAAPPVEAEAPVASVDDELEEADFYRQQGLLDEAREIYQRVLARVPNHPLAMVRLGEIEAEAGAAPSSGVDLEAAADTPVDTEIGSGLSDWDEDPDDLSSPALDLDSPDGSLAEEIVEAIPPATDLDLDEDPVEIDEEEERDPNGETPVDAGDVGIAPPLAAAPAPAPAGETFDLAAELSEALDPNEASSTGTLGSASENDVFAAVFSAFKKGVSKTLGEGDHEAHYDLGIAYREMGLLDDAVGEFRQSMQSPARRLDSLHMLGLCTLELDRPEEAVAHLQAALETEGLAEEQTLAIRFELGRAFEGVGELGKAEEAWGEVAEVDPDFCEVGAKLAALREKASSADGAPAEGFESFDELFDEEGAAAAEVVEEEPDPGGETFDDLLAEANAALGDADDAEEAPEPDADKPRRKKKRISFV